jgi:hypothetical protein
VVTTISPEAPAPTTAFIPPWLIAVIEAACTPPKVTEVAPKKFEPVIATVVPVPATEGENPEITGGGKYVNPGKLPVPDGLDTNTFPEPPLPTTAVIVVELTTVNDAAGKAPKWTAVTPVKFVPVIVTVVPLAALVGVKEVTVGILIKVKPARESVPSGAVTKTFPEEPAPTTAVIVVEFTTLKDVAGTPPKLIAVAPVKLLPVIVTVAPLAAD